MKVKVYDNSSSSNLFATSVAATSGPFSGIIDINIAVSTPTRIVFTQPTTGITTAIYGTGLAFDGSGPLAETGSINRVEFIDASGKSLITISQLNWSLDQFYKGLEQAGSTGFQGILDGLFASGPVEVVALPPAANANGWTFGLDFGQLPAPVGKNTTSATGSQLDDSLTGNGQNNVFRGKGGNDNMYGLGGNDRLYGGAGDDALSGNDGADRLYGGYGNDNLRGGNGKDKINGGAGNDVIYADGDGDAIKDRAANVLNGQAGDDRIKGGYGKDRIDGGKGNDTILAGKGADHITGGAGRDRIVAQGGNDWLSGGAGRDRLYGGAGNDDIRDGAGNDRVSGGTGNDVFHAGSGNDVFRGGAGADSFIFLAGTGADRIADFSAADGDTISFAPSLWAGISGVTIASGNDVINNFGQIQNGNAVIDFLNGDVITIDGIASLNELYGQVVVL